MRLLRRTTGLSGVTSNTLRRSAMREASFCAWLRSTTQPARLARSFAGSIADQSLPKENIHRRDGCFLLARSTGFEPAISSVTGRRDNHFTTSARRHWLKARLIFVQNKFATKIYEPAAVPPLKILNVGRAAWLRILASTAIIFKVTGVILASFSEICNVFMATARSGGFFGLSRFLARSY
jgi:hypothetical protein